MIILFIILYILFIIVIWSLLKASSRADEILEKEYLKKQVANEKKVSVSELKAYKLFH